MSADWSTLLKGQHFSIIIVNYVPLQEEVDIIKLLNKFLESADVGPTSYRFSVFNRYFAAA